MRTPTAHPDRLTAEERRELDDNAFGIPSRREFPLGRRRPCPRRRELFPLRSRSRQTHPRTAHPAPSGGVRHRDPQRNDPALGSTDRKAVTANASLQKNAIHEISYSRYRRPAAARGLRPTQRIPTNRADRRANRRTRHARRRKRPRLPGYLYRASFRPPMYRASPSR